MNKKIVGVSFVILILLCMALMLATLYKKSMPRVFHCSPWRNIIGYEALCNELNMVMNCSMDPCEGQTQQKHFSHLTGAHEEALVISATQKMNPKEQNEVMEQAWKLAYEHLPNGYFISGVNFKPTAQMKDSSSSLDVDVAYAICGASPLR